MHRIALTFSTLTLILLVGCGGTPRIDASSDAALASSIKSINSSLSEDGKKEFAGDCTTILMTTALKSAFGGAFGKEKGQAPEKTDLFKSLDGMTAAEVHARASDIRKGMEKK